MHAGTRPSLLTGLAVASVAGACAAASFAARPLSGELMLAGLAVLVGTLLLGLATDHDSSGGLYAGTIERLSAGPRTAWTIRAAVVATAPIAGAGVAAYAIGALHETLSAPPTQTPIVDWRRTAGTGMLGLGVILFARGAGLSLGGTTELWATLLICSGLALFWGAAGAWRTLGDDEAQDHTFLRTNLGLLLALAGALFVLSRTLHFHHLGPAIAGTATALAVLALVGGPWWLRTRRLLAAERIVRARALERAEMADHLHDSVLQTLALIQRRADDPAEVVALARRQERDLRDWLLAGDPRSESRSLGDGLRALVAEIEDAHRTAVELVIVGDAPLDARIEALIAATREALVNAQLHAPGAPVSVFARVADHELSVYVHDRGPGFDPSSIPSERRGIRESIIARMRRHGGDAEIHSEPGAGTEVILSLKT
jgi:signal transduction histidine kinase